MEIYYNEEYGAENQREYMAAYELAELNLSNNAENGEITINNERFLEAMGVYTAYEYDKFLLCLDVERLPYVLAGHIPMGEDVDSPDEWKYYPVKFNVDELKALDILGWIDIGYHLEELAADYRRVGYINGRQLLDVVPHR